MKKPRLLLLLTVLAMVLAACGTSSDAADPADNAAAGSQAETLSIVVTTTIWGDIVSNVVEDHAAVEVLFPIGADPHDYQLSATQAAAVQEADLVVVNGLQLEEGLLEVIEGLEADGASIIALADLLDPIEYGEGGHHHDHEDHDHGDEDGHGHHDDDGNKHDDHGVVAHACGHFDDDPVAVGTGGTIPDDHTRYSIELAAGSASVTLDWDEEAELSFFLGADAPISLLDEAGNELAAEATELVGEECEPIALVASFDLEPGTYTLAIESSNADAVDLVWEETGHHGDEEGHHDEEGDHDHGDEEGHHDDEAGEHHDDDGEHHDDEDGHGDGGHDGHDHGSHDPHVWHDPLRVATAVQLIAGELAALDPSIDWIGNAMAYADELRALDEDVIALLAVVPEDRRKMVTNHDAFGYFADRYDFEVVGAVIPSGSTLASPSSAELAELVEAMTKEDINAIFTETIEPAALAEAVAAEVGTDVEVFELFTGSLGGPDSDGETYIDMIRTNARLISEALS